MGDDWGRARDPEGLDSLTPKKLELIHALLEQEGLSREAGQDIPRRTGEGPGPLSFGQERLWFFSRMSPESPVFNIPAVYRVEGPLDAQALARALAAVHARHETLRTSFGARVDRPGAPVQRIAASVEPAFEVVEVGSIHPGDPEAREARALELAAEEVREPFDLERAPLLRVTLYRIGPERHLLLVNVHHIVSEVQSLGILMRDLAAHYAERAGDELPALPVHFADFAAWQRERIEGDRLGPQLAWWKERLAGELPTLELPTDHPRPAVQAFRGGTRSKPLDSDATRALRELCRGAGITPFTATLALWSALIARYGGTEDVLVGVPMTDRSRSELQDLIGFFVNTLVLRSDLSGAPSLRELCRRVHEFRLGAQANQELPFERLVEELDTERDLSRNPLFQVAFLYQTSDEAGDAVFRFGPTTEARALADPLAVHTRTSKFDASLVIWDRDDSLAASVEYNAELFEPATVDRMLGHYERLLVAAVREPDRSLASLSILTAAEEEEILVRWNDTATQIREDACVDQLFEEQADRTPDALAVVLGERSLTYRELEERANRLAHHLRAMGVAPDQPVAIATGRTPEMVVGILGALKAGGAYLPVDLDYPKERLAFLLEDAGVSVVLASEATVARLPDDAPALRLDADWPAIEKAPSERPMRVSKPTHLAYVIYTSGSTGTPKGVGLGHVGLTNLLTWHRRAYDVKPSDRATHLAGLAFDASVWEVWPYLTAGASLHLVPDDVRLSPPRLLEFMAASRITQSFIPTPLAEAVLREEIPADLPLEVVLTGGDKLHRAPERELPFRLFNQYGPTENTVVATATAVPVDPIDDTPPPIGRPIDNVRVFVLDRGGQPVPVGVPGELYIGGKSLAHGYFGRPDMTAERFVANPMRPDASGERVYATGDLVRWRADGQLEFLGRLDAQVKVRGFRVELGEIEAQLGAHTAVSDCAVTVREAPSGDAVLVGYAVGANGQAPDAELLRAHLRERLPEYMVPTSILLLEEMPLTPNGKVDRRALPEPDFSASVEDGVAPEGELEETIAAVWRDLLQLDRVGATTNFFDLGGHSLLLAQVHARLQASIRPDISIIDLFRYPTVSSLATYLTAGSATGEELEQSRDRGARRRAALQARTRARRRG